MSRERVSVMRGTASTRAAPEAVWRVLADPARVPEWFQGARDVEASPDFPSVGSEASWRVSRWVFRGRVVECDPPRLLRQVVETPSATSTITHRVVAAPEGARYEKVVEARWRGAISALLGRAVVARSVPREAARVARLAER